MAPQQQAGVESEYGVFYGAKVPSGPVSRPRATRAAAVALLLSAAAMAYVGARNLATVETAGVADIAATTWTDLQIDASNPSAWDLCPGRMIKRECPTCSYDTQRTIIYKRLTSGGSINFQTLLAGSWLSSPAGSGSHGNFLNSDFALYSTTSDADAGLNPWSYCNYDDPGIGFPRDCGPTGYVPNTWNSIPAVGGRADTTSSRPVTWQISNEVTCTNGEAVAPCTCSNGGCSDNQAQPGVCNSCCPGHKLVGSRCEAYEPTCPYGVVPPLVTYEQTCESPSLLPRIYRSTDGEQCDFCLSGYRLTDSNTCQQYTCTGAHCVSCGAVSSRTANNQCETCSSGYKLSGYECVAYEGSCANGELVEEQALRTNDNQCGSCNLGYYLSGTNSAYSSKVCTGWGGTCASGILVAVQEDRTQNNECQSCNSGYYMFRPAQTERGLTTTTQCMGWGGYCMAYGHGDLIEQSLRTQHYHCGACDAGYRWIAGTPPTCQAFGGDCTNGALILPQAQRTYEDHCGTCNPGYYMVAATGNGPPTTYNGAAESGSPPLCAPYAGECLSRHSSNEDWASGNGDLVVPQANRRWDNHCASCEAGYELRDGSPPWCYRYEGTCANGELKQYQYQREADDECGSCDSGYYLVGVICQPYEGECPNGQLLNQEHRTADDQCGLCNAGYYLDGNFNCVQCRPGWIKDSRDSEDLLDLPGSTTTCTECPAGRMMQWWGSDASECEICVAGRYAANPGTNTCALCRAGQFQYQTEQLSCDDCAAGKNQMGWGQDHCDDCEVGRYQDVPGQAGLCKACERGKYQDQQRQLSCVDCAPGYEQNDMAQTGCDICGIGEVASGSGTVECETCAPGSYQGLTGQTSCLLCEVPSDFTCPGGYTASEGMNDIAGCGMEGCEERYSLTTMQACATHCAATAGCVAFTWADFGEDKNHADQQVCTIYDTAEPTRNWAGLPLGTDLAPEGQCEEADNGNCFGYHDSNGAPCECAATVEAGQCPVDCTAVPIPEETGSCYCGAPEMECPASGASSCTTDADCTDASCDGEAGCYTGSPDQDAYFWAAPCRETTRRLTAAKPLHRPRHAARRRAAGAPSARAKARPRGRRRRAGGKHERRAAATPKRRDAEAVQTDDYGYYYGDYDYDYSYYYYYDYSELTDGDFCTGNAANFNTENEAEMNSCPWFWVGDDYCDPTCEVEECHNDMGDCENVCAPGCMSTSWTGDGYCDEDCNVEACQFDGGDCVSTCARDCYEGWKGNGHCDPACNVEACQFDNNDCADCVDLDQKKESWAWLSVETYDARDSENYNCDGYVGWSHFCGLYDDDDFSANELCCACGGGHTEEDADVCSPDCHFHMLGDSECNPECNTEECEFDGGDCNGNVHHGHHFGYTYYHQDHHPGLWRQTFCAADAPTDLDYAPGFTNVGASQTSAPTGGCEQMWAGGCANFGGAAGHRVSMGLAWTGLRVEECQQLCAEHALCAGFVFGGIGNSPVCALVTEGCEQPMPPSECEFEDYRQQGRYGDKSRDDNFYNFCRQHDSSKPMCKAHWCRTGGHHATRGDSSCEDVCDGYLGEEAVQDALYHEWMDEHQGYYPLDGCTETQGNDPRHAATPSFSPVKNTWGTGTYTPNAGMAACEPWTECPAGTYVQFEGSRHQDRTCQKCREETWTPDANGAHCLHWTVCKGDEKGQYDHAVEGVVVDGTPTSDVVCEQCETGTTSLVADAHSRCFELEDGDDDALLDRHVYTDYRELGIHAATHDRGTYAPLTEADEHAPAPLTGGLYDECPFDATNDGGDSDGICSGAHPTALAAAQMEAYPHLFLAGGPRVDKCPEDAANDLDKDGICDTGAAVEEYIAGPDTDIRTWNWLSNNMVGWVDGTFLDCPTDIFPVGGDDDAVGAYYALHPEWAECGVEPTVFAPGYAAGEMPPLGLKMFKADKRVAKVCVATDEEVVAGFALGEPMSCDQLCGEHMMSCDQATVVMQSSYTSEQAEDQANWLCDSGYRDELIDHRCDDVGTFMRCRCIPDAQPVKTQYWSMHNVCPGCYATTERDASLTGAMTTAFKIKKNTLMFGVKGASANAYVKLTVSKTNAPHPEKRLNDRPFLMEISHGTTTTDWYPVEWDLSDYKGATAVLEVVDLDDSAALSVDEFTFFNDKHSCLPTCMSIDAEVLEDGSTCFHFEKDTVPYVLVKPVADGSPDGVYCRQAPLEHGGSPIGPGLRTMRLESDPDTRSVTVEGVESLRENVAGPVADSPETYTVTAGSIAPVQLDYLQSPVIPRCLHIKLAGSHLAISTAEQTLGQGDTPRTFAYQPNVDNGPNGIEFQPNKISDNVHCVYNTLKPRCLTFSKPSVTFKPYKRLWCDAVLTEFSCLDQCFSIHCVAEDTAENPCGSSKAFRDCATCCDGNNNVASGCFRRRRRLGAAVTAEVVVAQGGGRLAYSTNECAAACLDDRSCIGFHVDSEGGCMRTSQCAGNGSSETPAATDNSESWWLRAEWNVFRSMAMDELGITDPTPNPKRKKRKRVRIH